MSQEDFSEFVSDFDSWTCVICREGDGANDSRTRHGCGNHEFHTKCLEEERRRDTRCPVCRFVVEGGTTSRILTQEPEHGNIFQFRLLPRHITDDPEHPILPFSLLHPQHYEFQFTPHNIYQAVPNRSNRTSPTNITRDSTIADCSYCRQHINTFMHWRMTNCNHHLHNNCLIENIIDNGIDNETGHVFCALCNYIRTH
jgi:Ring finger domain